MMGPLRCRTCGQVYVLELEHAESAPCCTDSPTWEPITWAEAEAAREAAQLAVLTAELEAVEGGLYPPNRAGRRAHARATGRRR